MYSNITKEMDNIKFIVTQSILYYFFYMIYKAIDIYQYFDFTDILKVGFSFFFLFLIIFAIFNRFYKFKVKIDISIVYTFFLSLLITYILVYLSNPSIQVLHHARTFPMLDLEIHKHFSSDSVFHTSLIQGIMNFGYPTTGIHDTPFFVYHALSHYIDALILKITNLEPFDHYGLMFFFKIWIVISSIVVFLLNTKLSRNYILFICSLIVLFPIILNKWNLIYSHGLWFTSVLLILSINKIYILVNKDELNTNEILFIFFVVILLGVGKISTGFMLAVFIGFYMLLKNYKRRFIYILGVGWVVFFYSFQKIMLIEGSSSFKITFDNLVNLNSTMEVNIALIGILFIFLLTYVFYRTKIILINLLSYIISLIIIMLLVILIDLNGPDLNYFRYSFFYIAILFLILLISDILTFKKKDAFYTMIVVIMFFLFFYRQVFDLNDSIIKEKTSLDNNYYKSLNQDISFSFFGQQKEEITLDKYLEDKKLYLTKFRKKLYRTMNKYHVEKYNTLLYVPKRVMKNSRKILTRKGNIDSRILYSITGVPLIYGIQSYSNSYGLTKYYKTNDMMMTKEEFIKNKESILKQYKKNIIVVRDFSPPKLTIFKYEK